MAQKISANAIRIGVNKNWKSSWFAGKKNYADKLHQDIKARKFIREQARSAGVDRVEIRRMSSKIVVDIYVGRPGVVIGRGGKGIEKIKKKLKKIFEEDMVDVEIHEVKPFLSAGIVAYNIAEALKKGMNPNAAIAQQIEKVQAAGAKGAKIWVAGYGPIKQVRTLKREFGSIPLTTLRADIDFAKESVLTKERLMGIKVWIYKGEKVGYQV